MLSIFNKPKTRKKAISYLDLLTDPAQKAYLHLMSIGETSPDIHAVFPNSSDQNKVILGQNVVLYFAKTILWSFKKDWKAIKKEAKFLSANDIVIRKEKAKQVSEKALKDLENALKGNEQLALTKGVDTPKALNEPTQA
ncbi:MAG: hypothetical protein FWE22_03980 [Firmicutes bacterium]|nr:hypothetical protein [Bacillota bacterium]